MTYHSPSSNRLPLPSAIAAADWRRQWDLDEAVAYRLAAQAATKRTRHPIAPLFAGVGTALTRLGEWLRAVNTRGVREPAAP